MGKSRCDPTDTSVEMGQLWPLFADPRSVSHRTGGYARVGPGRRGARPCDMDVTLCTVRGVPMWYGRGLMYAQAPRGPEGSQHKPDIVEMMMPEPQDTRIFKLALKFL